MSVRVSVENTKTVETTETTIRRTFGVTRNEDGEPVIEFRTLSGQGIATQTWPVSQIDEAIEVLSGYVDNPPDVAVEGDDVASKIKRSFGIMTDKHGRVCYEYKLTEGQGSKPARILKDDLAACVETLRDLAAKVPETIQEMEAIEAAQTAEAAAANDGAKSKKNSKKD